MERILLIVLLTAFAAACAPVAVPAPDIGPAERGLSAGDLAAAVWTAPPLVLRMRQTARFGFRGREVPMLGMMELNTAQGEVRLVALNEMGVKLFDLSVTGEAVSENYLLPELAGDPRLAEAVAASLRRIFLEPQPRAADAVQEVGGGYRLRGRREGQEVVFLFGGDPVRLLEKSAAGEREHWRVVYLDYQRGAEVNFPQHIVLEDQRAGYRLELRIDEVKRTDEQIEP